MNAAQSRNAKRNPARAKCTTVAICIGLLFGLLLGGCGRGASSVQAGQIAGITEDALVDVLLGTPPDVVRQAPPDKPLLTSSGYNRVLIAADARGFTALSKGAWSENDVRSLQNKIVSGVDKRISRKNPFHAETTTFPPPVPSPATGDPNHLLIATLTPVTQIAGSPDDIAHNRAKTLLLVRLTISDAQSGVPIIVRDYYSGRDVRR